MYFCIHCHHQLHDITIFISCVHMFCIHCHHMHNILSLFHAPQCHWRFMSHHSWCKIVHCHLQWFSVFITIHISLLLSLHIHCYNLCSFTLSLQCMLHLFIFMMCHACSLSVELLLGSRQQWHSLMSNDSTSHLLKKNSLTYSLS